MAARDGTLFFEPRCCGRPGTINGGVACGAVAALDGGASEVTLHRPIPPARPLTVRRTDDSTLTVLDRGMPLAEARPATDGSEPEAPSVSAELAESVAGRAGSTLLDPDGAVLATARSVWITLPRPAHRPPVGATP